MIHALLMIIAGLASLTLYFAFRRDRDTSPAVITDRLVTVIDRDGTLYIRARYSVLCGLHDFESMNRDQLVIRMGAL